MAGVRARLGGVVACVPVGDVGCEPEDEVGCEPVFVTPGLDLLTSAAALGAAGAATSSSLKSKRSSPIPFIPVARSPTRT